MTSNSPVKSSSRLD